ncbi:MAG: 2,3-bisphosphoglycerate-independent phosphoglycerate mutase, partial [Alphaproteobacteria bacterium]|nr:2,3-bisphosphoglycerate-independent phosphoglycerate mutase [Alphaproteobacteria bacterium]
KILSAAGLEVVIHPFLDGRDTPPQSALDYAAQVQDALAGTRGVSFGTVSGRYYAMDRDKRWDRIELAYRALVQGEGETASDLNAAISTSYAGDVTDEFVLPCVLDGYTGMAQGDGLLMINFRADRAREILTALLDPAFDGFIRSTTVDFSAAAGMVEYSSALADLLPALFPPEDVTKCLGEISAQAGLHQLRIAETEKYAHVTFFFNGGKEDVYENEDRILVPSPKVATYDLQPEMSSPEVTDKLVEAISSGAYDLIICNYANPDMVGHTGVLPAAIKAMETVDASLARLEDALEKAGGVMLLTADHGNLELMVDPDSGAPHTAHTTFEVPVLLIGAEGGVGLENGTLADVAPTLCALLGLEQPAEMTGRSLLRPDAGAAGKKAPRPARAEA